MNSSPQNVTQRQCPVTRVRMGIRSVSLKSPIVSYCQLTNFTQGKKTCSRRLYETTTIMRFRENDIFLASVREPLIGQKRIKVVTFVCNINRLSTPDSSPLFLYRWNNRKLQIHSACEFYKPLISGTKLDIS